MICMHLPTVTCDNCAAMRETPQPIGTYTATWSYQSEVARLSEEVSRAQRERDVLREKVTSLEAELACAKAFHDVAVNERDFYKTRLTLARERLVAKVGG